jgi:hypothetical protein
VLSKKKTNNVNVEFKLSRLTFLVQPSRRFSPV